MRQLIDQLPKQHKILLFSLVCLVALMSIIPAEKANASKSTEVNVGLTSEPIAIEFEQPLEDSNTTPIATQAEVQIEAPIETSIETPIETPSVQCGRIH